MLSLILLVFFIFITPSSELHITIDNIYPETVPEINAIPKPIFSDQTLLAGLRHSHKQGGEKLTGLNETIGPGTCAFDYNNDGWIDLFIVAGSGQTRYYGREEWWQQPRGNLLYLNNQDGTFTNVSVKSGLNHSMWGMGCVAADFDNDGYDDLLVTNHGENIIYKNNRDGTFNKITDKSGIAGSNWSTSAIVADFDLDGLLDIYIVNYIKYQKGNLTYETASGFQPLLQPNFNPALYDSVANKLYRNAGDMTFNDVTKKMEVSDDSGRGLAAQWAYINDDQYPDLIVSNDKGLPNKVFINNKGQNFIDKSEFYSGRSTARTAGISFADIENDGDLDLSVATNEKQPTHLFINNTVSNSNSNTLTFFSESSRDYGIADTRVNNSLPWSNALMDYNNDGWIDLFITNGLPIPEPGNMSITQGQPNTLWLNNRNETFSRCIEQCGVDQSKLYSSRGLALADFDNDGDTDIYIANNNALGEYLVNDTGKQHWLGVSLIGTDDNKNAIGTKMWLTTPTNTYYRIATGNASFLSSGDKRIIFGLHDIRSISRLKIEWPNGKVQTFNDITPNQYIHITQGNDTIINSQALNQPSSRKNKYFEFTQQDSLIEIAGWLLDHDAQYDITTMLAPLTKTTRDDIGQKLLALLNKYHSPHTLSITVELLKNNLPTIRIKAVKVLRDYESDHAMKWLLATFNDPDETVLCELSRLFEYYFHEEEAVITNKYLAVPYLLKLLSHSSSKVRICAIQALAETERFRAYPPILEKLNDENDAVTVTVARALGYLREKSATEPLINIIHSNSGSSQLKSYALISLKRINQETFTSILSGYLTDLNRLNIMLTIAKLASIEDIIDNKEDGVVIKPDRLSDLVYRWYKKNRKTINDNSAFNQLLPPILSILTKTHHKQGHKLARQYINHKDEIVRASAYIALLRHSTLKHSARLITTALNDASMEVRNAVLKYIADSKLTYPTRRVIKAGKNKNTMAAAIRVLANSPDPIARNYVIKFIAQTKNPTKLRLAALTTLNESKHSTSKLPVTLFDDPNLEIRKIALSYAAKMESNHLKTSKPPDFLTFTLFHSDAALKHAAASYLISLKDRWKNDYVKSILTNSDYDLDSRKILLELYSQQNILNKKIFVNISRKQRDPLSIDATRLLWRYSNPSIQHYLEKNATNYATDEKLRLSALYSLYKTNSKATLVKYFGADK